MDPEMISKLTEQALATLVANGPRFLLAIVLFVVGLRLINGFVKVISKVFERRELDETLRPFIATMVKWGLTAMLVISVASMIGIETTSFVAVLGAAGLAVGLALQGTLQNFAAGVMLLIFKPMKVGDLVEVAGHTGIVQHIEIFVTKLLTLQNRLIIIPNSAVGAASIMNYSSMETARVDFKISVAYKSDLLKVKNLLQDVGTADPRVLDEPQAFIGLEKMSESSLDFVVRLWVATPDYWGVYFDLNERFKLELDKAGIEIPFPQRVIHMVPKP
jgi:small conductance mechanosensitive channel